MHTIPGLTAWFDLSRHEDPPADPPADPADTDPPADTPPKTFTQADLDRIVNKRFAKVADYDAIKAKAEKFDELDAANKSDLEREQERAKQAEERASAAEARAKATAIRAAVVAAAAEAGAIKPDDVVAHLAADAITVNDDGTVDGAAEAVKAVLDARPHWVTSNKPQGSADMGARGGKPPDFKTASADELTRELAQHGLRPRST